MACAPMVAPGHRPGSRTALGRCHRRVPASHKGKSRCPPWRRGAAAGEFLWHHVAVAVLSHHARCARPGCRGSPIPAASKPGFLEQSAAAQRKRLLRRDERTVGGVGQAGARHAGPCHRRKPTRYAGLPARNQRCNAPECGRGRPRTLVLRGRAARSVWGGPKLTRAIRAGRLHPNPRLPLRDPRGRSAPRPASRSIRRPPGTFSRPTCWC